MKKLELIEGETLICDGCQKQLEGLGSEPVWLLDHHDDPEYVQPYCEACMLKRYDKP